jgi:cytochrome c oxidase assembly protein Cox11
MNWDFEPVNGQMVVNSGETALTFYKAFNHSDTPVIGNINKINLYNLFYQFGK